MRIRRSSGDDLGVAWRRAVDLGDEQAHRVGADVDRRDPGHGDHRREVGVGSSGRRGRRRRRAGTRSGRAGTSRPRGCRRRRPTGRGPAWSGGDLRRRARPRTRVVGGPERGRVDGRLRPRARRPRPRAGETGRFSSGSTSQYRVGIGVPSRVKGALRMTTGAPSASRTTTSNSACGSRPSRAVSAATSSGAAMPAVYGRVYGAGGASSRRARVGARSWWGRGQEHVRRSPGCTSPYFSRASARSRSRC